MSIIGSCERCYRYGCGRSGECAWRCDCHALDELERKRTALVMAALRQVEVAARVGGDPTAALAAVDEARLKPLAVTS